MAEDKQTSGVFVKKGVVNIDSDEAESSAEDSSSSSGELGEDASSFSTSPSSLSSSSSNGEQGSHGPLYGLSELMAQLPIKRGLSKFYDGQSQSFTSLTSVRSLQDLMKPDRSKRLKLCKSYEDDLDRPAPSVVVSEKKGSSLGGRRRSYLRT